MTDKYKDKYKDKDKVKDNKISQWKRPKMDKKVKHEKHNMENDTALSQSVS